MGYGCCFINGNAKGTNTERERIEKARRARKLDEKAAWENSMPLFGWQSGVSKFHFDRRK